MHSATMNSIIIHFYSYAFEAYALERMGGYENYLQTLVIVYSVCIIQASTHSPVHVHVCIGAYLEGI